MSNLNEIFSSAKGAAAGLTLAATAALAGCADPMASQAPQQTYSESCKGEGRGLIDTRTGQSVTPSYVEADCTYRTKTARPTQNKSVSQIQRIPQQVQKQMERETQRAIKDFTRDLTRELF